jgi:diguanylate cyclase (GGDEF)-like protein
MAIEKSQLHLLGIAVLFIDLDSFKHVNDSLGHLVGDELLKKVAERIKSVIRREDTFARFGGDEFVIIIEGFLDEYEVSLLAQKIIDSLLMPFNVNGQTLYITSSIGISLYPKDDEIGNKLLMNADAAMYKAKGAGRSNFKFYSAEMTTHASEHITMETSLRKALQNNEFVVYYQPQINAKSKKLMGMEALVRWKHPIIGLIQPASFIPLAEETGLIIALDKLVMESAMRQVKKWYDDGLNPGVLAVNMSIKQLEKQDFMTAFEDICTKTEFKPEWLALEITESQIMANPKETIEILKQISQRGIQLAIDDFGTGYSSLSYLKQLPINKLKIDQSFIRGLPSDAEDVGITKTVIALANSLNLSVIAEGVETEEQKDFLVQNGCENIQGYLFSKPLPADEIEKNWLN